MSNTTQNLELPATIHPTPKPDLAYKSQYRYVGMMLDVVGRSLVMASHVDSVIQEEIGELPENLIIMMSVFGTPLGFGIQVQSVLMDDGTYTKRLVWLGSLADVDQSDSHKALKIYFKHLRFAYQILSFKESTATGFANNRMVVDGDVSLAVILVRCLNRLESVILPKILARKAIKAYPDALGLPQKIGHALKIYGRLLASYVFGHSSTHPSA